jgi:hypothetical protein
VCAGCGQTICVNLVPPSIRQCINRVMIGLGLGTIDPVETGEALVAQIMPKEVEEATEALRKIIERLPVDPLPPPPSVEDLKRIFEEKKE